LSPDKRCLKSGKAANKPERNMKPDKAAKRIRKMRERKGLSQGDLARKMRCSRSHANLENGWRKATREHGDAVARVLR
jgi:ribosome-binding protein aMBF1 (putative translation factor)